MHDIILRKCMIRSKFWNVHPGDYAEGEWGGEELEVFGLVLLIHGPDRHG